jgi:hypothetical protein
MPKTAIAVGAGLGVDAASTSPDYTDNAKEAEYA